MKVQLDVHVTLRPTDDAGGYRGGELNLSERQTIDLGSLSDAAGILVKLHEFFEELKKRGGR